MIRWVESTPVDRTLIGTGKTLVYVGIVTGLYLLWSMSQPRAGFFGVGARGAGTTQGGLLMSGFVVLYHAALGFLCQGSAERFRNSRRCVRLRFRPPRRSIRTATAVVRCSGSTGGSIPHRTPAQHLQVTPPAGAVHTAAPMRCSTGHRHSPGRRGCRGRRRLVRIVRWQNRDRCAGHSADTASFPHGPAAVGSCVAGIHAIRWLPGWLQATARETARILRAAATIVGNSERRVQALGREHDIKVELGVPAEGWTPPADVRDELEKRAARNGTIGSQARAAEAPDRAEGAADNSSQDRKVGGGTPGSDDPGGKGSGRRENEAGHRPASYRAAARRLQARRRGTARHRKHGWAPGIHSKATGQRIPPA